jgi:nitroimidazol reductase NimA-like FMN-containing flavoprotein (pyridoxamine 5'-phosphate oxidase superfamily)
MANLAELARRTLASNRYMVLGIGDLSGRPRVSPVWFSPVDHQPYWLSSADAHHSRNIEERPEVSRVVLDSKADPHTGQAVYLEATAGRVPEEELGEARVTASEIHVRGRDFGDGFGPDQRVPIAL